MRKLILHIGTHKTGTTSIQKALAVNREWLRERGLIYPAGGPFYSNRMPHHEWSHGLTGTDRRELERSASFIDHAASLGKDDDTLLISAEPIYRHIDGADMFDFSDVGDYWDRRKRYVQTVATVLAGFDVRVIVWFREKVDFARSLFAELIRREKWNGSFDQFLEAFSVWFEYERHLELFCQAFPTVDVHSYEIASEAGLVRYFFETIGVPTPPGSEDIWVHRTDYGALTGGRLGQT